MRIDSVKKEDKSQVLEMTSHTWEWGDYVGGVFDQWLQKGLFLKAVSPEGEIAGIVHGALEQDFVWVEGLRVKAPFRKMGVGTSLVGSLIAGARKSTARALIRDDNYASLSLFRGLGFDQVATVYYHEGSEALRYQEGRSLGSYTQAAYLDNWIWYNSGSRPVEAYEAEVEGIHVTYLRTEPVFLIEGQLPDKYSFSSSNVEALNGAHYERFVVVEKILSDQ
ncbi:MAG: GNAT family N-acetyltransferase [Thermoprotei archaeon]